MEKAEDEYEGPWEVVVYGECGRDNFKSSKRRGKRQAIDQNDELAADLIENPEFSAQIGPAAGSPPALQSNPVKFPGSADTQFAGGVQTLLGQIPKIKNRRTP